MSNSGSDKDRAPELFEACLELLPEARDEFLKKACGDNVRLQEHIARLVAAHERLNAQGGLAGVDEPRRVGPYEILKPLGEGGMGVVYEALQTDPVRRHVAIKIIRRGMDSQAVASRFETERQALAVMDHPCIAKVFDAGAMPDGRLYFAMELVRGEPITTYCDRQRLSVRERLGLFVHLCHAVQHAHQKGVIHRDLKPTNVLVEEQGREPMPKVIDFGIAKATAESPGEDMHLTRHGQLVGTPAYMSPEQAAHGSVDIDTRSDIYALGVMLYELLSGALPLDPSEMDLLEFVQQLRWMESDAPRASVRFTSLGAKCRDVARSRSTTVDGLRRELERDLDWILAKAIEKSRARRYPTATGMAADIERYLRDEPVSARPPGRWYRATKFVNRHRAGVLASAVAALALVMSTAGVGIALVRATKAEEAARRDATTAERVAGLLESLFSATEPGETRGRSMTAEQLLKRGTEKVRLELRSEPAVQSRMLSTLSRVHGSLGLYEEARVLAQEALQVEESLGSSDEKALASALLELGESHQRLGRFYEARAALQRALALREGRYGPESVETAEAMARLANLLWQLDELGPARELNERALAIRQQKLGPNHLDTAHSQRSLALVLQSQGEHKEALSLLVQAQSIYEARLGSDHPTVADNIDSIALIHAQLGMMAEARAGHQQAYSIRRKVLGENHPSLAFSLLNIARLDAQEGKLEEARRMYEQGIRLREESLGADHPRTADIVESLAIVEARLGHLDRSQSLFERALRTYLASYGERNRETLESRRNLALLLTLRGSADRAVEQLVRAYEGGYGKDLALEEDSFEPLLKVERFRRLLAQWKASPIPGGRPG